MIVVTSSFAGILDDWLASLGQATREASPRLSSALSLEQWAAQVHAAIAQAPGRRVGWISASMCNCSMPGRSVIRWSTPGPWVNSSITTGCWKSGSMGRAGRSWSLDSRQVAITWDGRLASTTGCWSSCTSWPCSRCCALSVERAWPPLRVEVTAVAEGEAAAYREAFGCPVYFNQPALRLVFAAEALQAPIDLSHATLSPAWRSRQRTLRETVPSATELIRAVGDAILHTLPAGAPVAAVAARLHLSPRTLQRRLTESGCTYRHRRRRSASATPSICWTTRA